MPAQQAAWSVNTHTLPCHAQLCLRSPVSVCVYVCLCVSVCVCVWVSLFWLLPVCYVNRVCVCVCVATNCCFPSPLAMKKNLCVAAGAFFALLNYVVDVPWECAANGPCCACAALQSQVLAPTKVPHSACLSVDLNKQFPGHFVDRMPSCVHVLLHITRPWCLSRGGTNGALQ